MSKRITFDPKYGRHEMLFTVGAAEDRSRGHLLNHLHVRLDEAIVRYGSGVASMSKPGTSRIKRHVWTNEQQRSS